MRGFIFDSRRSFFAFLGAVVFVGAILWIVSPYLFTSPLQKFEQVEDQLKQKAQKKLNDQLRKIDTFNNSASNLVDKRNKKK